MITLHDSDFAEKLPQFQLIFNSQIGHMNNVAWAIDVDLPIVLESKLTLWHYENGVTLCIYNLLTIVNDPQLILNKKIIYLISKEYTVIQ